MVTKAKAAYGYLHDTVQAVGVFFLTFYCSAVCWSLLPMAIGMRSDVVMSGSMAPKIQPGDVVVSVPLDASKLKPGMIISFTDPATPGRNIIHRMIARNNNGTLTTRGDANRDPDSTPLPPDLVHGQARVRIPMVGLPAYWLRSKHYLPFAITVVTLLVMVIIATGKGSTKPDEELTDTPGGGEPPKDDTDTQDIPIKLSTSKELAVPLTKELVHVPGPGLPPLS